MKKKILTILLALAMMLTACSQNPETTKSSSSAGDSDTASDDDGNAAADTGIVLEMTGSQPGAIAEVTQKILDNFTKETGIKVEYSTPANYEDVMRTRMASNDLPDIFDTHGWSVMRYSEYMRPLNDQSFVSEIVPAIAPMVTAENSDVFVLPVNTFLRGVLFNRTVLEDNGINYLDIKTWDDFNDACATIKASGVYPITVGGKDPWTLGDLFNMTAASFYTNDDLPDAAENQKAFKDGTFDWNKWKELCDMVDYWTQQGYFNVDVLTADYASSCAQMGKNEAAFCFYGGITVLEILSANPDANIGMMTVPAKTAAQKPSLVCGELVAYGVWKDTKQEDAALQLINYLAKPENMTAMATALTSPAALQDIPSDTGPLQEYYDDAINNNTFTVPFFDRIYLPSGMYDDLCITGASIVAKQNNAVADAVKQMKSSYEDKMAE